MANFPETPHKCGDLGECSIRGNDLQEVFIAFGRDELYIYPWLFGVAYMGGKLYTIFKYVSTVLHVPFVIACWKSSDLCSLVLFVAVCLSLPILKN